MPNFIRTKQIDQVDLSGFVADTMTTNSGIILNYVSGVVLKETVLLTGNQNISGIKNFPQGIIAPNLVYNTGNQTISGAKTFERINIKAADGQLVGYISGVSNFGSYQKLIINGDGGSDEQNVIIQSAGNSIELGEGYFHISNNNGSLVFDGGDHIYIYNTRNLYADNITASFKNISAQTGTFQKLYANNLVYNTGNQTISGIKTFATGIIAPNLIYNTGNQTISGIKTFETGIFAPNLIYNTGNQSIAGNKTFANNLNVSGDLTVAGTLRYNEIIDTTVTGNLSGYTGIFQEVYANNLVYNTGNQTIYGSKTFSNNGFDIVTSGETISISSGLMVRVPYGTNPVSNKDFDINLLSFPYSNSYISMGYETGRVGPSINSANSFRELKIWETGGYTSQSIYKMARFGPYGVILSEDDFSKVGIGTAFPEEKVHISGGNLKVEGTAIANNLIYNTGNQTISGVKTFATGIFAPNLIYNTGNQTISGNKIFKNNIQIGDSQNAIYSDGDNNLIVSGYQSTLRTLKLIAAGGIYNTSITFGPGSDGLVFNSPDYFFRDKRPEVRTLSPFSSRPVALLDEVVLNTGNQTISGVKTFATGVIISGGLQVSGTGIFNAIDLNSVDIISLSGVDVTITSGLVVLTNPVSAPNLVYNTGNQNISGVKTFNNSGIFTSGLDLNNSNLINATPQLVNETTNFIISGNDNGRVILANHSTNEITGRIVSGNPIGFNTSIIQINSGIFITGSGNGITINSFGGYYRTAGKFATVSLLHTGNNGYIMYGNTI